MDDTVSVSLNVLMLQVSLSKTKYQRKPSSTETRAPRILIYCHVLIYRVSKVLSRTNDLVVNTLTCWE